MLLQDKIRQAELEKNGFVVIPFLTEKEVLELNTIYTTVHKGEEPALFIDGIHMTTWCQDADYKKEVSQKLESLFKTPSELFFKQYRRLNNVFIVKKNGQNTTFKVHQDWNVVDESKYQSVNVWIPLHDVDEASGALWVLKGSHRIGRNVRGAGYLFPDYSKFSSELEKAAISVKLKAGEAIVFYHSVIHGSPPNLSTRDRVAACFSVIPQEAPLCIYFQPNAGEALKQHEPEDDFVFQYDNLRSEGTIRPPSPNPVASYPAYVNKPVERKELMPLINSKKSLFNFWKA
jgi:hypothetical protein